MQINSIKNQNFGTKIAGDFPIIARKAIMNGFPRDKARMLEHKLKKMLPDDCTMSFFLPREGTVTGKVIVENWKGSGVDMEIRPIFQNRRNLLTKYTETAEALAKTDFQRNNGIYTIV